MILASGLLILVALAPEVWAQHRRHAYGTPEVEIWSAARRCGPGEQVRFTVTVDRPCFVRVFAVDDAGRRQQLTRRLQGVRVSPGNPLRSHGRHMHTLWGPHPRGEITIVAVAQARPFRAVHADDYLLRANARRNQACQMARYTVRGRATGRRTRPAYLSLRAGLVWGSAIPGGALIFLDGILIGHGSTAVVSAAPGVHRMTVVTPGGHKQMRRVKIESGGRHSRTLAYDSRGR
jgi:hypothetical protein